jgi:RecQ-mediated genome instability protein 1
MHSTQIYAVELHTIPKLGMPPVVGIGCKMILRKGCKVARGMVLLETGKVVVLGGKVEVLDREWREGLEGRLREEVEREGVRDSGDEE